MTARPLTLVTGRHPFEACVCLGTVAPAVQLLITGYRPGVMARVDPAWQKVWLTMIVVGAVGTLAGAWWRGDVADGLTVEAGGLALFAAMITLFVVALAVQTGAGGFAGQGMLVGVTAAAWLRVAQIIRSLWRLVRARGTGTTTQVTLLAEGDRP